MKREKIIAQLVFCDHAQGYKVRFDDESYEQFDTFTLSQKILDGTIEITNAKPIKFGGEYSHNYILRGLGIRLKDLPEIKLSEMHEGGF